MEDHASTAGYPFSSSVSPRGVLMVDCRSVDVWMPVIKFRETIETLYYKTHMHYNIKVNRIPHGQEY